MKRLCVLGLVALMTLGQMARSAPDEKVVQLEYVKMDNLVYGNTPIGTRFIQTAEKAPAGEWKLPEFKSEKPYYAVIDFAGKQRLAVLDQSTGKEAYDLLYFDLDGDGELTDEKAIEPPSMNQAQNQAKPVEFKVKSDGVELPYNVFMLVYSYSTQPAIYMYGGGYFKGEIKDGDKTLTYMVGDSNCNGVYGEPLEINDNINYSNGQIAVSGDRCLYLPEGETADYYRMVQVTDYVILGDRTCKTTLDMSKKTLTLTPLQEGLETLELSMTPEQIILADAKGKSSIAAIAPDGAKLMVPDGSYRMISYLLSRKDGGGTWRVAGTGIKTGDPVKASADQALKIGEPFTYNIEIPDYYRQRFDQTGQAQLSFAVQGATGEVINSVSFIGSNPTAKTDSSGRRPDTAKFKIIKPDGEVVHQGAFEYG